MGSLFVQTEVSYQLLNFCDRGMLNLIMVAPIHFLLSQQKFKISEDVLCLLCKESVLIVEKMKWNRNKKSVVKTCTFACTKHQN